MQHVNNIHANYSIVYILFYFIHYSWFIFYSLNAQIEKLKLENTAVHSVCVWAPSLVCGLGKFMKEFCISTRDKCMNKCYFYSSNL